MSAERYGDWMQTMSDTRDRLAEELHDLEAVQHYVVHVPADGYVNDEPTEIIECATGVSGHLEDADALIAAGFGDVTALTEAHEKERQVWEQARTAYQQAIRDLGASPEAQVNIAVQYLNNEVARLREALPRVSATVTRLPGHFVIGRDWACSCGDPDTCPQDRDGDMPVSWKDVLAAIDAALEPKP